MLEKFNIVGKAVEQVGSALDKIFTSDEERGEIDIKKKDLQLRLVEIQTSLIESAIKADVKISQIENEKRLIDLEKGGVFGKFFTYFNDIFRLLIQISCFILVALYILDELPNMNETKEYIVLGAFVIACMKTFPTISNKIFEFFSNRRK